MDVRRVVRTGCIGLVAGLSFSCKPDPVYRAVYARDVDAARPPADEIDDAPPLSFDLHQADRKQCSLFGEGSLTTDSIGPDVRHGGDLPFKHVVVLVQENRSFDHYLSGLMASEHSEVDCATDENTNPAGAGSPVPLVHRYPETRPCDPFGLGVNHEWEAVHLQYDDGLLDGFVATNLIHGERSMGYYPESSIPYYYWLARTFGVSDRHFCSLLGPTWPNRYFALAATSAGCTYTPESSEYQAWCESYPSQSIVGLLRERGKTVRVYTGTGAQICAPTGGCIAGSLTNIMLRDVLHPAAPIEQFATDARAGNLPDFAFLEPHFDHDSEHPPFDIRKGEALVRSVVEAIGSRPDVWESTVLFVTHDEHGGYYDHVRPPPACEPDEARPPTYAFDRLGFRVPLFVISAYTVPRQVSHFITDHTSILRFVENLFDLPAMTRRDANAWPLLDRFDFSQKTFPTLPTDAPASAALPDAGCPE